MSEYKENIKFRTEVGRELRNTEVDSNFKYVANPWSPLRIYEKGMIVYHKIEDEVTSNIALTHWFIATKRTTRGFFILDEWEIMSGWDTSITNTSENAFSRIIVNSNLNGSYSSASNGIIEAASVQASLGFVAGSGINLEFDDTNNLIKISRGFGGGEANTGINIGTGIGVFRDKTNFDLNLRSLKSSSSLLDISLDGTDEIEFNIDVSLIHLSDIGNKVLNDLDNVNATPTLNQVLSWNGTQWVASTISSSIYTGSNLGSGSASVFSTIAANDFKFRRIKTDTAILVINQDANYISFDFRADQLPLKDLRHVEINNPQEGEALVYNFDDLQWENKQISNIYNADGNIISNRVVDLNGYFLQYSDSSISTGVEPYFHVEAAPGFLKFVGEAPVPGIIDTYFSGDLFLQSDNIYTNGIYEDSGTMYSLISFKNNSVRNVIFANDTGAKLEHYATGLENSFSVNSNGILSQIIGNNGTNFTILHQNGNFGINVATPMHAIHVVNEITGQDAAYFEGDVTIEGKLNVTGLIDPTGLVLNEQAQIPYTNSADEAILWVGNTGVRQTLYFTDENGIDFDLLLNYNILLSDTYENLKSLADNEELIPGKYYLMYTSFPTRRSSDHRKSVV